MERSLRQTAWRGWLAVALLSLLLAPCLGLTWLGYQRVELFHAAFVNGCSGRPYQAHWQNRQRYPQPFHFDFLGTPTTFVLVMIWLENGPTLQFSREFPTRCPGR